MEYVKDSLKTKVDFSTPNQVRDIEVHTLFLTLNTMKVATIYLLNGILGRNFSNLHSSGRKAQVSSLPKTKGSGRIFTTKLGVSQSLIFQEEVHNLNVTLKGYPKKFWGL